MFGKVLLVVSNFSSMATLYYGLANKEYIISTCIVTTSIVSAVFHMLETFEFGSQSVLQLLRLLDFYYSYKSIYVVTTSLFLDYSMEFFYYDIPVQTILITLAVFFTGKDSFLFCIVPMCLGIIAPLLLYYRDRIITINPYDPHLALLITMVLLNIYFYMTETYYDYNIFHSLHHLICFSTPAIIIIYKQKNKIYMTSKSHRASVHTIMIPKISSITDLTNSIICLKDFQSNKGEKSEV